jgi:DNA-directed RNA polymerase subunit omega
MGDFCYNYQFRKILAQKLMPKKHNFDSSQIMYRSDELMNAASNRYRITVQVAKRAKQRRFEDFDNLEEIMKPVLRAIVEMSDELTQPEIISDS